MSEPASNPVSPKLERIARKAAHEIVANVVPASWEDRNEVEFIDKVILSALPLQVEKEEEGLGSETPLPLGQHPEETNGNPLGEWKKVYAIPTDELLSWATEIDPMPEAVEAKYELRRRLAMLDPLLNHEHDDSGECSRCGEIVCPFGEPLHFHHDGCPACSHYINEPPPQSTASIHESARRNPKSDFNEGGMK